MTRWITTIGLGLFAITTTPQIAYSQKIVASWYDCAKPGQCSRSKKTASGAKFNPDGLTAAHRTLPFGTKLRLKHKNKTIVVTVNDRGPFVRGRHLDLSRGAARKLGCGGICHLEMSILR